MGLYRPKPFPYSGKIGKGNGFINILTFTSCRSAFKPYPLPGPAAHISIRMAVFDMIEIQTPEKTINLEYLSGLDVHEIELVLKFLMSTTTVIEQFTSAARTLHAVGKIDVDFMISLEMDHANMKQLMEECHGELQRKSEMIINQLTFHTGNGVME